jgi:hypothetical protein
MWDRGERCGLDEPMSRHGGASHNLSTSVVRSQAAGHLAKRPQTPPVDPRRPRRPVREAPSSIGWITPERRHLPPGTTRVLAEEAMLLPKLT